MGSGSGQANRHADARAEEKEGLATVPEKSDIEAKVAKAFPGADQKAIRESTIEIAKQLARTTSPESLEDDDHVSSLIGLSMMLGPHITLDQQLREAADEKHDTLSVITVILRTARLAELSAFGQIAEDRVKVIKRVEQLKDEPDTLEAAFQSLNHGCALADRPAVVAGSGEPELRDPEARVQEVLQG